MSVGAPRAAVARAEVGCDIPPRLGATLRPHPGALMQDRSPVVSAGRVASVAAAAALTLAAHVSTAVPPTASPRRSPATAAKAVATQRVRTGLEALQRQVQEFTLPNGLKFIVVERHQAPVFSFMTVVDAGSA